MVHVLCTPRLSLNANSSPSIFHSPVSGSSEYTSKSIAHLYTAKPLSAASAASVKRTSDAARKVMGLSSFPNTPSRRHRRVTVAATAQTACAARTVGTAGTNDAATQLATVDPVVIQYEHATLRPQLMTAQPAVPIAHAAHAYATGIAGAGKIHDARAPTR